ncbi:MAG: PHP domain-containing protein [Planctomycetota bacterium]|jgi:predicted metal-dependent phosphoesterase TrpH
MNPIKTLIHIHTDYSYDSNISLSNLARFAETEGFACIAVTDHDTIEGALRFQSMTSARVIVGEEVTTRDGHLIGLFLKERVRPGMTAEDTAIAIRRQGGLVLLPHPFVKMFSCGLGNLAWRLAGLFDAVEVNNAQNLRRTPERRAHQYAEKLGMIRYAGADSHLASSIGPCYQIMADFDGPAEFLESLRAAELTEGRHPLRYFAEIAPQVALALASKLRPRGVSADSPDYRTRVPNPVPVASFGT